MRTALITGAAGGMGRAVSERLIKEGYRVYGLDIRDPEIRDGMTFIRTDLTDEGSVRKAFETVSEIEEKIDLIVLCQGIYDLDSLIEIDEESFKRIFDVNLFAAFKTVRAFLPLMDEGARVVIISSELAAMDPMPFTGLYAVTKTALEKYAFSLRMEMQLLGRRVSVVRPGAVDTGFIGESVRRLDRFMENTKLFSPNAERFRRIVGSVESKKIPPERIADIVLKAAMAKRPRYVYNINRNPLLKLYGLMPARLKCLAIKKILKA